MRIFFAVAIGLAALSTTAGATEPALAVKYPYNAAQAQAKASGCPLVVMIGAKWCPACRQMEGELGAIEWSTAGVAFGVLDYDSQPEFCQSMMVDQQALPQVIIWRHFVGVTPRAAILAAAGVVPKEKPKP
jgi:thiol-disulfide isomerase/thioredoxin